MDVDARLVECGGLDAFDIGGVSESSGQQRDEEGGPGKTLLGHLARAFAAASRCTENVRWPWRALGRDAQATIIFHHDSTSVRSRSSATSSGRTTPAVGVRALAAPQAMPSRAASGRRWP